jgi:PAS domain S-box-containing protein
MPCNRTGIGISIVLTTAAAGYCELALAVPLPVRPLHGLLLTFLLTNRSRSVWPLASAGLLLAAVSRAQDGLAATGFTLLLPAASAALTAWLLHRLHRPHPCRAFLDPRRLVAAFAMIPLGLLPALAFRLSAGAGASAALFLIAAEALGAFTLAPLAPALLERCRERHAGFGGVRQAGFRLAGLTACLAAFLLIPASPSGVVVFLLPIPPIIIWSAWRDRRIWSLAGLALTVGAATLASGASGHPLAALQGHDLPLVQAILVSLILGAGFATAVFADYRKSRGRLLNESRLLNIEMGKQVAAHEAALTAFEREVARRAAGEAALEQSESRYRILAEASLDGIVIHDGNTVLEANAVICAMLGTTRDTLIGTPLRRFIRGEFLPVVDAALAQNRKTPFQIILRRTDGSTCAAEIQNRRMEHPTASGLRQVAAIRDLSALHAAEQERRAYAARLERELAFAARLQHSIILPETTIRPGWRIHARFLPCEETAGDYLEIIESGNRVYILSADVSGHGLIAALYAFMLHAIVTMALKQPIDAGDLLDTIAAEMGGHLIDNYFLTIGIFAFDPQSGVLDCRLAGHPAFVVDKGDGARLIETASTPVAEGIPPHWQEYCIKLPPGGRLLLFSDGLFELDDGNETDPGKNTGTDWILAQMDAHSRTSGGTLLSALLTEASRRNGSRHFSDDISICLLERPTDSESTGVHSPADSGTTHAAGPATTRERQLPRRYQSQASSAPTSHPVGIESQMPVVPSLPEKRTAKGMRTNQSATKVTNIGTKVSPAPRNRPLNAKSIAKSTYPLPTKSR